MTNNIRIASIIVKRLFGLYDHTVSLKGDRVTVIHGPNGVGKTAFLQLTNAFLKGRYHEIARIPFKKFEIKFDNGSCAGIEIEGDAPKIEKLHLYFTPQQGESQTSFIDAESIVGNRSAEIVADSVPFLRRIGNDEWVDIRSDEIIGPDEVIKYADDANVSPKHLKRLASREPKSLREIRALINVHFIEAQRLIRVPSVQPDWRFRGRPGQSTTNTVQAYSKDLKSRLESALATYAKQSQKLDQTFPQRLLSGELEPFTPFKLKEEMQKVEAARNRLKQIGILDSGDSTQGIYSLPSTQLDGLQPNQVNVMSVYARDTRDKLAVLNELSEPVEILLNVLNKKFSNKRICISRELGLAVFGPDGKSIPIAALSSGEQHEIVLLYDLLFKVKPNTLVLIDEPELSLHINWQKGFMDDLFEIIRVAQFDVLMATHSPYIVGDRSDLLVDLPTNS